MDINQQRGGKSTPPSRAGLGTNNKNALNALHAAIKKFGVMEQVDGKRNKCIKIDQWRDEFKANVGNDTDAQVFKKLWWRVKTQLTTAQKVELHGDWCWAVFDDHDQKDGEFGKVIPIK
jgi:hypothetical protein